MQLLRFVLAGLVAGWVLGKLRRGKGYGLFGNLAIGTIGSVIGWFLMGLLKVEKSDFLVQMAMAVAGAIVFFLLIGSLKWKRTKKAKEEEE